MCGLAGILNRRSCESDELRAQVGHMADQLVHRGPDDRGIWVDAQSGIALGFRRLSIVDLSTAGHQPMISACGRYVIVFNGEVYNADCLRPELERAGHCFRGHSDTEVMLAAIVEWGLHDAVRRFIGMFAFALWDRKDRVLRLVRDRLGIKPLYYGEANGTFLFGSELKALRAHPSFEDTIDRGALSLQLRYGYIPQPFSIYSAYKKLPPGTILTRSYSAYGTLPQPETYWSVREATEHGAEHVFADGDQDAIEQLDVLLRDAVRLRMIADVDVGAFLSGGTDSSLTVAMMQTQSSRPVKTFSIGFVESGYDEAAKARKIASYLGTDHTELYVTSQMALDVIPKLPHLYDEPLADSSQIPTYLVCALAKQQVSVSLSGDGGDELFGGYNEYLLASRLLSIGKWIPFSMRKMIASGILAIQPEIYTQLSGALRLPLSHYGRSGPMGDKLHKFIELLPFRGPESLHRSLMSHWSEQKSPLLNTTEPQTILTDPAQWVQSDCSLRKSSYLDLVTYLPDDILVKVDRASMAVSLEARVPLLDHRVVEFAARIPASMKMRQGKGKWLLRALLAKYLPETLIQHTKLGFGVPITAWLRGPLREWAEAMLDRNRLEREGFFRPDIVGCLWNEHISGRRNWHSRLWDVLMFQAWNGEQSKKPTMPQLTSPHVGLEY